MNMKTPKIKAFNGFAHSYKECITFIEQIVPHCIDQFTKLQYHIVFHVILKNNTEHK